jgi:hypothetical protein
VKSSWHLVFRPFLSSSPARTCGVSLSLSCAHIFCVAAATTVDLLRPKFLGFVLKAGDQVLRVSLVVQRIYLLKRVVGFFPFVGFPRVNLVSFCDLYCSHYIVLLHLYG